MTENNQNTKRPPVVAIMGHIDHGKSTLLSYIRKSKMPTEAGGITQHISAYEVEHQTKEGELHKITFLDTPGHEAFAGIRRRGASVADIAILVVSAEDGVKPQTVEALKSITESKTPYIVAINKIDRPEANVERTKQSLAEHEIYVEGYGGSVPWVAISAKTGEGIPELLDLIILSAELENFTANPNILGTGVILESNRDPRKGISATCIIKDGHLEKGHFIASGKSFSPIRIMENYLGKPIDRATFSSPVKIIGWDSLPEVGNSFESFKTKEETLGYVSKESERQEHTKKEIPADDSKPTLPIILKADTGSSLEAMIYEIKKLETDRIKPKVISSSIGTISENDIQMANGKEKAIVIGFHTKIDPLAKNVALRLGIEVEMFDIIYKMSEWLAPVLSERTPKTKVEEVLGSAKILKVFSKTKDKQVVGGRVESGAIAVGSQVKILRRDAEIGSGKIRELQQQKVNTSEVASGEFGTMIEAKVEIAPGDKIESIIITEK